MREVAEAFLRDTQSHPRSPEAAVARRILGATCWFQGDYVGARPHLEQALAAYDYERDHHLAARIAFDPGVPPCFYLALVLWPLGDVDRAGCMAEQGLGLALQGGHIPTVAFAHLFSCVLAAVRRKPEVAMPHARALMRLAPEQGQPHFRTRGPFLYGWARARAGDPEGEAGMREGLASGGKLFEPLFGTLFAEVEVDSGRLDVGLATLDAQLAALELSGQRWFEAEMHRVRRPVEAELRQLTVMFCDLVGSTALSGKLDPEDLRGIIGSYHRCCTELIERNGGFVAKYMGDGVLAYFGYPQAHEHDAERAVYAGLALVEAVPKLSTAAAAGLQVRVGIATGLAVVGDLIGSGEAQERGIVGETPNLAARLQGIAEPNTIVIAEGTRRLLGNLFELHDLGSRDLKGIAGPARAWEALRASSVESRFEALHASGLTALVGREEECERLLRRWARAKSGEGQVVLIGGEAGIGKSRLTAALMERLGGESHTRLRYFCSPQHSDSALYPSIAQNASFS
jgi:class 3 adenylate cyclase